MFHDCVGIGFDGTRRVRSWCGKESRCGRRRRSEWTTTPVSICLTLCVCLRRRKRVEMGMLMHSEWRLLIYAEGSLA